MNTKPNILFVDDEPNVLRGLERALWDKEDDWELRFVSSGQEALNELERQPAEIIVSDFRMPGMNGARLLKTVRRRHPETIRFMLSGQADYQSGILSVPVAHQFLSKPCDPEILLRALERAQSLRGILSSDVVRKVSSAIGTLPHNPQVYSRLSAAIHDENVNLQAIASIIEQDVGLTMKVLQMANSTFFVSSQTVTSIAGAIQSLGLELLQQLVLAAELFDAESTARCARSFSSQRASEHALTAARIARTVLAEPCLRFSASVAAMLHDIGQLLLAFEMPDEYEQVLTQACADGCSIVELERAVVGASHAEVGAYLAGLWGFPEPEVRAILRHHDPVDAQQCSGAVDSKGRLKDLSLIVVLADHMAGETRELPEHLLEYCEQRASLA